MKKSKLDFLTPKEKYFDKLSLEEKILIKRVIN